MSAYASGPGPTENAAVNSVYRAIKLQSNGTATDIDIESDGRAMTIHLEPGEMHQGSCKIVGGIVTGVIGWLV